MAKSLEGFQPMFGKPKAEWEVPSSLPLLPFMFHVHALDSFHLRVHVTDFQSCTWAATRSIEQLEDLRDDIGIGGSWSDFIDYLIASVRSENVKLVLSRPSKSSGGTGPMFAKLIAHKSKGMPLISIALDRIMDSTANDAMANLSLELFKAYETKHNLVVKEQERTCWLTQILSAEKEKSESLQHQLDTLLFSKRKKLQKSNVSDKALPVSALSNSDVVSVSETHNSPEKPPVQDLLSTKVGQRVVPAYRRAKVRGVFLQDTEGSEDN